MSSQDSDSDEGYSSDYEIAFLGDESQFHSVFEDMVFMEKIMHLKDLVEGLWNHKSSRMFGNFLRDVKDDKSQEGLAKRWALYEICKLRAAKDD